VANYGNYIFWGHGPSAPPATSMVLWHLHNIAILITMFVFLY